MKRILAALSLVLFMACSNAQQKPLIGISSSRSQSSGTIQLSPAYTDAIMKAGGTAVVLPVIYSREQADALLATLDGIVLSGGVDVAPSWYGEEPLNETVEVDIVRDYSDSLLARAALDSGKPILAICRGEQLLNVVMGGSLYQDIPSQVEGHATHGGGATHKIQIDKDSFLYTIFGIESMEVNSYHHQAVKEPAPGIRITARSEDGLVEAFEADRIWAVQFHPEKSLAEGDETILPFFRAWIHLTEPR